MKPFIAKGTKTFALITATALTVSACASGNTGEGTTPPEGGTASLTIMVNAISGGKNAAEADWIENFVIPGFVKEQQAK